MVDGREKETCRQQSEMPVEMIPRIYPLRPSARVEAEIAEIELVLDGRCAPLCLEDQEKQQLLFWEDQLGAELEKISELKMRTETLVPEYFLTVEGKSDFQILFPDVVRPDDVEKMTALFYASRELLAAVDANILDEISSRSTRFADQRLEDQCLSGLQPDGELLLENLSYTRKVGMILDPAGAREKLSRLLALRKKLKKSLLKRTDRDSVFEPLALARFELAKMYLSRINEMLAGIYGSLLKLQKKPVALGQQELDQNEQYLYSKVPGKSNTVRTETIFDKFLFGTGLELGPDGNYRQISAEIQARVEAVLAAQADFSRVQSQSIAARGLDPEKVLAPVVSAVQRKLWGRRVLAEYGILSEEP